MTDIRPDTPLRLDTAVKIAFPAGGMSVHGLRKEIARGRLEVEKIAGKHFVTLAAIARMRELCRAPTKPQMAQAEEKPRPRVLQGRPTPQEILRERLRLDREK